MKNYKFRYILGDQVEAALNFLVREFEDGFYILRPDGVLRKRGDGILSEEYLLKFFLWQFGNYGRHAPPSYESFIMFEVQGGSYKPVKELLMAIPLLATWDTTDELWDVERNAFHMPTLYRFKKLGRKVQVHGASLSVDDGKLFFQIEEIGWRWGDYEATTETGGCFSPKFDLANMDLLPNIWF